MPAPSIFPSLTLLLPGVIALTQNGSAAGPEYLAALAVTASAGAWQIQRWLPGFANRPLLATLGSVIAVAAAHWLAHSVNSGGCCATPRG